jgi:oligoribonuclease (3'-5' exoribonuclease)
MVVREVKHPFDPVEKVVNILHKRGVDVSVIYEEKKKMLPMLKNYATKTGYKRGAKNFIKEVIRKLSKK